MNRIRWAGVVAGAVLVWASLSACIAADVEVIGALGVTVDEGGRPVLVVEACDGAAIAVALSFDRDGLADDEENEAVASWTASEPAAGKSELVLHAPSPPWTGPAVDLSADRGYIAGGVGEDDKQVLTQVAFSGAQLAEMDPDMVYRNDPDPDVTSLVARTPAEFSGEVCARG